MTALPKLTDEDLFKIGFDDLCFAGQSRHLMAHVEDKTPVPMDAVFAQVNAAGRSDDEIVPELHKPVKEVDTKEAFTLVQEKLRELAHWRSQAVFREGVKKGTFEKEHADERDDIAAAVFDQEVFNGKTQVERQQGKIIFKTDGLTVQYDEASLAQGHRLANELLETYRLVGPKHRSFLDQANEDEERNRQNRDGCGHG